MLFTTALALVTLAGLLCAPVACVTEAAIKDLCSDDATCTGDPDCPAEPPNRGVACDLPADAECFGRWERPANIDCQ